MMYKTDSSDQRKCSQCGERKHISQYHKTTLKMINGRKWTGLHPSCKDCRNKKRREKYKNDRRAKA
jgi:hypothetical protein